MKRNVYISITVIASTIFLGFAIFFLFVNQPSQQAVVSKSDPLEAKGEDKYSKYKPPSIEDVPDGEEGELIKLGYKYSTETATALDGYVGNTLSCASCHANGGMDGSLDLVGITKTYPMYNPRAGKEVTVEDRINGCFRRSMNGKPLSKDGPEMKEMVAYFDYISQNVPDGTKERPWAKLAKIEGELPEKPNVDNGREIYQAACASCHGQNGQGANNGLALWGDNSYNIGAGMTRLRTAGGFIKAYVPKATKGGYEQGSLTDEEALNIAAYINSQNRPDFPDKIHDWPNGDAPDDVAYETLAQKKKMNK